MLGHLRKQVRRLERGKSKFHRSSSGSEAEHAENVFEDKELLLESISGNARAGSDLHINSMAERTLRHDAGNQQDLWTVKIIRPL